MECSLGLEIDPDELEHVAEDLGIDEPVRENPHLKYYTDEEERWASLMHFHARCSPEEATVAVGLLARAYGLGTIDVKFTRGNRSSRAGNIKGRLVVVLNEGQLSWLLVAHEFCHAWDEFNSQAEWREHRRTHNTTVAWKIEFDRLGRKREKPIGAHPRRIGHDSIHRDLVARACAFIIDQGWPRGALAEEPAYEAIPGEERRVARAALPPRPPRPPKPSQVARPGYMWLTREHIAEIRRRVGRVKVEIGRRVSMEPGVDFDSCNVLLMEGEHDLADFEELRPMEIQMTPGGRAVRRGHHVGIVGAGEVELDLYLHEVGGRNAGSLIGNSTARFKNGVLLP